MQTSSAQGHESSILPLICVCLLGVLAWNLFLIATTVSKLISIHEATKPRRRSEISAPDNPDARSVPSRGPNQFFPRPPAENECNYVDFVPVRWSAKIHPDLVQRLLEDSFQRRFQDVRRFVVNGSTVSLRPGSGTRYDLLSARRRGTSIRNDMGDRSDNRLNGSDEQVVGFSEKGNIAEIWANDETSWKNGLTSKESCATSCADLTTRSVKKCTEKPVMKSVSVDAEVEKYGEEGESGGSCSKGNQVRPSCTAEAHLEIGRKEEDCRERSGNLEMKIEESAGSRVNSSLEEKFLISILQESRMLGLNLAELKNERGEVDSNENAWKERGQRKENRQDSKLPDEFRELSVGQANTEAETEEDETRSREEDDYRDQEVGAVPKTGTNCTEEKSVMHRSKDATEWPSSEAEREEDVGSPPKTNSKTNSNETESAIFLHRTTTASRGKEEEELNAIVRRMIILELKRHRKMEETMPKKAHSDTDSMLARKRQDAENRTDPFNGKDRTFFRDLLQLEESLRKDSDKESEGRSSKEQVNETMPKRVDGVEPGDADRVGKTEGEKENERGKRWSDSTYSIASTSVEPDSNIILERKVNASCLRTIEEGGSIGPWKVSTAREENQANKSTQTEYVYVIRAVRSCPIRKRNIPLQLQLQRLGSGRDGVCSKTVYASLDLTKFVFRKASDNLIYEKGKASSSPSYIPSLERHRWKYVTPSQAK